MLPTSDAAFLAERDLPHSISTESNMICVVIKGFKLPQGLDHGEADLLIRVGAGYPDVPPDMWWFDPPVRRADGKAILATDVTETHLGRGWQRWSRHLTPAQWHSGVDGLQSYLALVRAELERSASGAGQ